MWAMDDISKCHLCPAFVALDLQHVSFQRRSVSESIAEGEGVTSPHKHSRRNTNTIHQVNYN